MSNFGAGKRPSLYLENAHQSLRDGKALTPKQKSALLKLLDGIEAVGKGRCPLCDFRASGVVFVGYQITWCCAEGCNP